MIHERTNTMYRSRQPSFVVKKPRSLLNETQPRKARRKERRVYRDERAINTPHCTRNHNWSLPGRICKKNETQRGVFCCDPDVSEHPDYIRVPQGESGVRNGIPDESRGSILFGPIFWHADKLHGQPQEAFREPLNDFSAVRYPRPPFGVAGVGGA